MSYTTLYILNQRSVRNHKEYRNSWGSAPILWDYLSIKYLGLKSMPNNWGGEDKLQSLWDLARDSRLSLAEVIAHRMTFDFEYVPIKNIGHAADACREIYENTKDFPSFEERENHWGTFAEDLEALKSYKFTRHARGICLGCTSVSDPWRDEKSIPTATSIFR